MGKYRPDGSPYPEGDAGLFEWARDLENLGKRIVRQETLWNGLFVSTVWTGLVDHNWGGFGPPLIFETTVFDHFGAYREYALYQERWPTWSEAEAGHARYRHYFGSIRFTLKALVFALIDEVRSMGA